MGKSEFLSDRIDSLKPVFANLKKIIDNYIEIEGEPPYWLNETASVSMIVAAASRAGFIAMSDYRGDKASTQRGRCDLYIRTDRKKFEIEAKAVYVRPGARKAIESALLRAGCDAVRVEKAGGYDRAAMVFAVLSLPVQQSKEWENRSEDMKSFKALCGSQGADVCWIWHADSSEAYNRCKDNRSGRFYPAMAILVKRLK